MAIFTERMDVVCDRMGGIQKQTNTRKMELCYDAKSFWGKHRYFGLLEVQGEIANI